MLAAVAGLTSREGVELRGAESVAVSFPDFFGMLDTLAQR
jgi:5-enolpyruvylshikimate-3-phosphate synthase